MAYFPVAHSTLSADALLAYVQQHYDIGELVECLLLNPGLNDTYLLRGEEQRYILRVYRADYRTLDDVLYEMDMLLHLHRKGVPVSYPLAMKDGRIVFFDFDCCGPGWRAYDIAVFRWARALNQQDMKLWEAFLEGYTERRTLRPLDMAAIPLFVALRQYWLLGLHARGIRYWGRSFIDKQYLDRHMNLLKQYSSESEDRE